MVRRHREALGDDGGGGRVQSDKTPEEQSFPLTLKAPRCFYYNPPSCTVTPWLGLPNDAWAKGRVPLQRLESKE